MRAAAPAQSLQAALSRWVVQVAWQQRSLGENSARLQLSYNGKMRACDLSHKERLDWLTGADMFVPRPDEDKPIRQERFRGFGAPR